MLADPNYGLGGQEGKGVIPVRALLPAAAVRGWEPLQPHHQPAGATDVDMVAAASPVGVAGGQ